MKDSGNSELEDRLDDLTSRVAQLEAAASLAWSAGGRGAGERVRTAAPAVGAKRPRGARAQAGRIPVAQRGRSIAAPSGSASARRLPREWSRGPREHRDPCTSAWA